MSSPPQHGASAAATARPAGDAAPAPGTAAARRADALAIILVVAVAIVMWLPRRAGPIDLRWDGAVYYILGTSLAEGKGYKLLNEPGEIDAVQYPPLLPAIVAAHQLLLGTSDPTTVGRWLRLTSCLIFIAYAVVVLRFLRTWLPVRYAILGALLSLFCWHAWFLSDALFPEVWFSVATLLFLMSAGREGSKVHSTLAYIWVVAAYALRTVGLAGFVVWVLDSVIRRRFRQAALRALLALIPVASWQMYVASVERSHDYTSPTYEYQRSPSLFYNVSYATNIALRDPFTPEKGPVRIERRIARNALDIPVHVGETLSASRRYFEMWLHRVVGHGPMANATVRWGVFGVLSVFGLLVLGGTGLQLLRGQRLEPLYVLVYAGAMCLTPFPGQFLRYLMPVAPLLALSAIVFLARAGRGGRRWPEGDWRRTTLPFLVLGPALLVQMITAAAVYTGEHRRVAYVDAAGKPVTYRLFFYNQSQQEFDQTVDYLQAHAQAGDVVSAGTPHWIHLRTGLKTVMPPFEPDAARAQA
nr:hypothetical protein [Acidobacteriota bacterium]